MMFGILALILFLGLYVGFPFWIYWFVRLRLKAMAQAKYHGRPVALFLFGLLGVILASVFLVGGLLLLVITQSTVGVAIAGLIGVGLAVSGAIGWVVLLFQRLSDKSARLAFERNHPLPKLQLWMQDLFAAAFCFGSYMALSQTGLNARIAPDTLSSVLSGLLIIAFMACGLYFAMDVCRRSLHVQKALPRFAFVFLVMMFTAYTVVVPTWMAWRA